MSTQTGIAQWRERIASPLPWHYTGFALLLALAISLGVRLGMDWTATHGRATDVLAGKQVQLRALDAETAPLRGLDKRVEAAHSQLASFYSRRIPPSYSAISSRIGDLQVKSGVRLTRVQYSQGKPGSELTEISMDSSISGDYPAIMRFVNSLERDPLFFVIRSMAFTGQQGGTVNLHIQLSTWMQPADAVASGLPSTPENGQKPSSTGKEGE